MKLDADRSPVALELKAYFDGRVRCVKADPPCAIRPCAKHHAEAYQDLGATTCPACDGADLMALGDPPCPVCDGYGRLWVFSVSALASSSATGGPATAGTGLDGAADPGRGVPATPLSGPAAPTSESNQPRTENPRLAEGATAIARNEGNR